MSKQSPPLKISWKARPAVLIAEQECPFPSYCCNIMRACFSRQMEQQKSSERPNNKNFSLNDQTNINGFFIIVCSSKVIKVFSRDN